MRMWLLSHISARFSLSPFLPPRFHIFIWSFTTAYPFPSQRSLCKILSSERCVRFRVRVRTPVCVSPGQVNDLCAWWEGSGGGRVEKGWWREGWRNAVLQILPTLPVNALLSLCAMRRKKKERKKRARASFTAVGASRACAESRSLLAALFNGTYASAGPKKAAWRFRAPTR